MSAFLGNVFSRPYSLLHGHPSHDDYLLSFLTSLVQSTDSASKAAGLYYPYIFLTDAGSGQSPFPSYGNAASLPKMKAIARRYEPDGVFQRIDYRGHTCFVYLGKTQPDRKEHEDGGGQCETQEDYCIIS